VVLVPVAIATLTQAAAAGHSRPQANGCAGSLSAARFEQPPGASEPTMLRSGTARSPGPDRRQLANMPREGISEALIFPDATATVKPAFFSEGWFVIVGHALREAKRTGMRI
jgi:hypothetical protein